MSATSHPTGPRGVIPRRAWQRCKDEGWDRVRGLREEPDGTATAPRWLVQALVVTAMFHYPQDNADLRALAQFADLGDPESGDHPGAVLYALGGYEAVVAFVCGAAVTAFVYGDGA